MEEIERKDIENMNEQKNKKKKWVKRSQMGKPSILSPQRGGNGRGDKFLPKHTPMTRV